MSSSSPRLRHAWRSLAVAWRRQQSLVISDTDLEAALSHLRRLPHRNPLPETWQKRRLLNLLREKLGQRPKLGQVVDVAPGVFAIVKPFGVDVDLALGRRESCDDFDRRLQVWLLIRPCGTDPSRITDLYAGDTSPVGHSTP